MLVGYECFGVGREDGERGGEHSPIFYRGARAAEGDTFWLSDTPEVPSCSWGGQKRICTRLRFLEPFGFSVFNTHLENTSQAARQKGVRLILRRLEEWDGGRPVFLIGDFNFKPGSPEYRELAARLRDSYREDAGARDDLVSSHGFRGTRRNPFWGWAGQGRIDYIWVRGDVEVRQSRILFDHPGNDRGIFSSDHWPVLCEAVYRPPS